MLWVIWDILLPLTAAFLAGLFIGWLIWRWRRMRISSEELATIRRSSARYKADADTLRSRNAELADRLRGSGGGVIDGAVDNGDLAAANEKINMLQSQLKNAKSELAEAHKRSSQRRSGGSQLRSSTSDRVRELESELNAAQHKIEQLQTEAVNAQSGSDEVTGSRLRTRSADPDIMEEIVVRDKMIATLKHSLEQYGEQQDATALMAELEIKNQRILALETMLGNSKRVA